MLTKYASFEVSKTLEVKGAATQQRHASLDKVADYHDYRTDDGYLYARIIAISSRVNKNNDGWPSVELAGGQDIWDKHVQPALDKHGSVTLEADPKMKTGFSTFIGKPHFVDHNNSDTKRARGVVVDAKLHVKGPHDHTSSFDPYYGSEDVDEEHLPPTQVELLIEVDAKSFPLLAKAIVEGAKDPDKGIDGFSMGCDVDKSKCSHCGNEASSPREYCSHIKMKGAEHKVTSGKHAGKSRKSYENCYGIKFFEISAVFDPADETALLQDLVHEGKTAAAPLVRGMACPTCHGSGADPTDQTPGVYGIDNIRPCPTCKGSEEFRVPAGNDGSFMLNEQTGIGKEHAFPGHGQIYEGPEIHTPADPDFGPGSLMAPNLMPQPDQSAGGPLPNVATPTPGQLDFAPSNPLLQQLRERVQMNNPYLSKQGSYLQHKLAENALPQFMHTQAPTEVDTLREEKICPVCGEEMEGEKCATCGHIEAPDGFDNPDLQAAQNSDLTSPDLPGVDPSQAPNAEQDGLLQGAPAPGDSSAVSYLQSRKKAITPGLNSVGAVTAGKIKTQERPLKSSQTPATDEPQEAVVSDQDRPVTSSFRTAMDLIRAAKSNQGNDMQNNRTAADAPSGAGAQKRVNVEGVGGVIDATNEKASQPEGPHSYEEAGKTVDVTGKGGIIEDSNAEASKPSKGTESLPTAGRDSDDSGFNKDKTTDDSGKTRTFDNSNEPGSAVTDKVFTGAKQGVKPQGGADVQPQRRENVEEVNEVKPLPGTDQWTGTGGNGVTRQQDPVTKKVDPGIEQRSSSFAHVVAAMKLADAEIEIGVLNPDQKYDRVAELEALTPEELAAEERVISRVRTAGLAKKTATRREAATRPGEVTNLPPAFSKQAGTVEAAKPQLVNDELGDSALFMR
jgi:hypothetical protein